MQSHEATESHRKRQIETETEGRIMTAKISNCEMCMYYSHDEDYLCYVCEKDLDCDDLERFYADRNRECPYYRPGDEYTIVRKQN